MTDEAARPEPAESLTRAELNLPSGNVGKLVEEMRSHAGVTAQTQTDLLLNQAADLLISQQESLALLPEGAKLVIIDEQLFWVRSGMWGEINDLEQRATKAEALGRWRPMSEAIPDGRPIVAVGRYLDATTGFPRLVHYYRGAWREVSRGVGEELVCWAWHPRDESWPLEGEALLALNEPIL